MFLLLFSIVIPLSVLADMNDYCVVPAFVPKAVKPNVLILMDFSGSMQFPAHLPCDFDNYDGYVAKCGISGYGTGRIANYNPSKDYFGYFEKEKYYTYDAGSFRINELCSYTNRIGGPSCISGNLLNWVTSTRIDVARKVLTGGRTSVGASDTLESEGSKYTYRDSNLKCSFSIDATTTDNRRLSIENYEGSCVLGTLSNANVKIKAKNVEEIKGLVQEFYDKIHFEFMVFSTGSGSYDREGEIRSGKDGTLSSLISAINNELPYFGTPTGEALYEAMDFFSQSNDHNYEQNSSEIKKGNGNKDPFYDGSGTNSYAVPCRKAFVLLISDGAWNGNIDPVKPAREMNLQDLRTELPSRQNVPIYTVYAFGDLDPGTRLQGRVSMITTAIFGGFEDFDSNSWPFPFTSYPQNSKDVSYPLSSCNPSGTWDERCREWDREKKGLPYNFFEADDGESLREAIFSALQDMLKRVASGTAASILASQEGSSANLIQAIFYPRRVFEREEVDWVGEVHGLWHFIDPVLLSTYVREDTVEDRILNFLDDRIVELYFDSMENETKAKLFADTDGDGDPDSLLQRKRIEELKSLFKAGMSLWRRNLSTNPRRIYTSDISLLEFSPKNKEILKDLLQAQDLSEAEKIINYIHGFDFEGSRKRQATIGSETHIWKLGDIVSSTPRVLSSTPLNTYHLSPPSGYSDSAYYEFINSEAYRKRGVVFFGANDGMLHAVKLGTLKFLEDNFNKAKIEGERIGEEIWAYIPKNVLPYLKYLSDPFYCHLFLVDLPPLLVEASINGEENGIKTPQSFRTILIGGMGLGGASRDKNSSCSDCVKTPVPGMGFSSYFALDVTDPENPSFLWEFSHEELGFSTSGPAIVRIGEANKNGRWFVLFGSGPTGPIDTSQKQFLGRSDQKLKIFIVDLRTGSLLRKIDTGIENAFSGSLFNSTFDAERGSKAGGFYSDDVVYMGYTRLDGSSWKGGVLRIVTKESNDPREWTISKVIEDIGPVTASISKLQNLRDSTLWLYFGTGRFFYRKETEIDDETSGQRLFGIKEPCYIHNDIDPSCSATVSPSSLYNATTPPSSSPDNGWYINLDPKEGFKAAERVITDPLSLFSGIVLFTTFSPSSDPCSLGGDTYIWAIKYDTGGAVPKESLKGEILLQVSTGEIKRLELSSAFTQKEGRRTQGITGIPPKGQALSVVYPPKPLKRILHMKER